MLDEGDKPMKKENLQDEHCPYCKRHCSLSDPHCKKGKALAVEKQKSSEKLVEKKKKQSSKSEPIEKEDRLTHLFYACTLAAPNHKKEKGRGYKKKYYILSTLAKKGELTLKELQNYTNLSSDKLEELRNKLAGKQYIVQRVQQNDEVCLEITEEGRNALNKHTKKIQRDSYIFDSLSYEERDSLEHVLEKLYEEWTSKREDN
jgi:DNA-binding MarR family transcriptional regulator